jgi:hypothetical protein
LTKGAAAPGQPPSPSLGRAGPASSSPRPALGARERSVRPLQVGTRCEGAGTRPPPAVLFERVRTHSSRDSPAGRQGRDGWVEALTGGSKPGLAADIYKSLAAVRTAVSSNAVRQRFERRSEGRGECNAAADSGLPSGSLSRRAFKSEPRYCSGLFERVRTHSPKNMQRARPPAAYLLSAAPSQECRSAGKHTYPSVTPNPRYFW